MTCPGMNIYFETHFTAGSVFCTGIQGQEQKIKAVFKRVLNSSGTSCPMKTDNQHNERTHPRNDKMTQGEL